MSAPSRRAFIKAAATTAAWFGLSESDILKADIPPDQPETGHVPTVRSSPGHFRRHAVFCAIVPAGFAPENEADQPIEFQVGPWAIDAGLSLKRATTIAQRFNREQMSRGIPRGEWAFVVACCRPQRQAEGGVAI